MIILYLVLAKAYRFLSDVVLGPKQLTHDVKSDVRTLKFKSDVTYAPQGKKTPNDVRRRSLCDVNCQKCHVRKIIKHRSPMQTEQAQPTGEWIMPETR